MGKSDQCSIPNSQFSSDRMGIENGTLIRSSLRGLRPRCVVALSGMSFQAVEFAVLIDVQISDLDSDFMKLAVFLLVCRDESDVVLIPQLMAHGFVNGGVLGIESRRK